jgi:cytochrome c peroxidase
MRPFTISGVPPLRRPHFSIIASSFAVCALFALCRPTGGYQGGDGFLPLGPTPQPPNVVALSPAEQLGKDIFFDATLSNPPGYACATCHAPETGFTVPVSVVNAVLGTSPGVIPGRFGKRKAQAVPYSSFSPRGPVWDDDLQVWLGGNFWDGRATGLPEQARMPFLDVNEMANDPIGPLPPHAGGYAPLVAQKIRTRPYAALWEQVFGPGSLANPDAVIYSDACLAITEYESSKEVNRFSSKLDASRFANPPQNGYKLSASETNGINLFFGKAQCFACHSSSTLGLVMANTGGRDVFTMYCYANIGVPKNPGNPIYTQTNTQTNPFGANPSGFNFIDYGLGMNPNPAPFGAMFMAQVPGDFPTVRGLFKAPSLRNVDKRPSPSFVKAYMHNGVFKSLEQVVNFYNQRNIAVNKYGHQISFDLRVGAPSGYTPLFAPPEVIDNVQNASGVSPANAGDDVAHNGQVGNLGLTASEETDVVNFLKILTDQ